MERPNTVSGLVAKRAEIAGQIEVAQISLRRLIAALHHLDATIRLFDPNLATETIKSKRPIPPQHQALRGEVKRIVLDTMREARRPVTTGEIATRVMANRMLPTDDIELRKVFVRRIGQCLMMMKRKGAVRPVDLPGRFQGWELC